MRHTTVIIISIFLVCYSCGTKETKKEVIEINIIKKETVDSIKDFFSKNNNAKNLFTWSKEFEKYGFKKNFVFPDLIDAPLKGVLSVILDFMGIEQKKFFDLFPKSIIPSIQLGDNK